MTKERRNIFLIIAVVLLILTVTHFELVSSLFGYLWELMLPVIIGFGVAFVLDVPVVGFENLLAKLTAKAKKKPKTKTIHAISIVLTIVCVLLVFALLFTLVIPELVRTVKILSDYVKENWPMLIAKLEEYNINTDAITEFISTLDIESAVKEIVDGAGSVIGSIANTATGSAVKEIADGAGSVIGSIANTATSTVSSVASAVIGVIIAIYVLIDRDTLKRQAKKIIYSYLKKETGDKICYVGRLTKTAYAKFFSGQCLEAVLLGVLIFISFVIFDIPYAALVGVVTAICALIPYVGAFVSCALAVILSFFESPQKALICLVVYLVVQFIETQFIYPHVVGGSVGLSPLWTLVSVLIGGKLLGLIGMVFFIPLVSVIYTLLKEDTDRKIAIRKKQMKT